MRQNSWRQEQKGKRRSLELSLTMANRRPANEKMIPIVKRP